MQEVMEVERSPTTLGEMVREVMVEKKLSLEDAVEEVWATVSGGLPEWWESIGHWVVRSAERDLLRTSGVSTTKYRGSGPQRKKSWRERFEQNPDLVWDMEFPVGQTGIRKALGEFTADDIKAVSDFYLGMADTMRFRGEYWGRIGAVLEDDETLREAHESGRITRDHVSFLGERGRVDGELTQEDTEVTP